MTSKNPFYFRELPIDGPFCNREDDLKALCAHARSLAHVVMYSPRRFGKTSLVKRVQKSLGREGAVCIYTDFYGITSVEDVASRLAKAVFKETHAKEPLFKKAARLITSYRPAIVMTPDEEKGFLVSVQIASTGLSGFDLLEDVLESLGRFIQESGVLVHLALDEFQEITSLPDALKIEGIMRQYIQQHQAAYIFVGSRRRILLSIFNEQQRPFFKSSINYELTPLPEKRFSQFITGLFSSHGKSCESDIAQYLVKKVNSFPYYTQKLAYFVFENATDKVQRPDIEKGMQLLLKDETPTFEGIFLGLTPGQIGLLGAIASEPSMSIFSQEYIQRHRLGSIGGAQAARKKLLQLDLIEQRGKVWGIVDPVLKQWLQRQND